MQIDKKQSEKGERYNNTEIKNEINLESLSDLGRNTNEMENLYTIK